LTLITDGTAFVAAFDTLMVPFEAHEEEAALLAECPALAANWRERLGTSAATS
jgi:hypothetical protein